jgi:NDP-sugar pyrophosphorylase family protein
MIEFIISQETKPEITDGNGNKIIDFLEKDISIIDERQPPTGIGYFLVNADQAMRIDLITKAMYGYTSPIEKVLKFNNIGNPFSIDEGDILVHFDLYSLIRNMRDTSESAKNKIDIRKQYLTPEKKSKIDPTLQAFDKRNKVRKIPTIPEESALPPNYADFGDQEIEVRNGKLYFGPNVTKSKESSEDPLSKSEFIARLIKNRINNR